MSRTRKQQVQSTLLGAQTSHHIRCPLHRTLGLRFDETASAVATVESLMRSVGLNDSKDLRVLFTLPDFPLMARPAQTTTAFLRLTGEDPLKVLEQALWLGLCSPYQFDPSRPVVWTETSLRRRVELFEPAGFYL
jgi:hypothetical protein